MTPETGATQQTRQARDPDVWLQCAVPRPEARQRLVCFPHAGGSASFFRGWADQLPGTEVRGVCYPGRGERLAEPPPTDLPELGRAIADALVPLGDRPLALLGHSMGAAIAFEAARALEARGVPVAHLFASGSRDHHGPVPVEDEPAQEDDDAETIARLLELGGTDPELAADPGFQELVLPYIRSDTRMFHSYALDPAPRLRCPVTTIVGDADPDADLRPWSALTEGPFREVVVSGDHFYLVADPPFALLHRALGAPAAR